MRAVRTGDAEQACALFDAGIAQHSADAMVEVLRCIALGAMRQ